MSPLIPMTRALVGAVTVAAMLCSPATTATAAGAATVRGKVTIVDSRGNPKKSHAGVVVFLDEMDAAFEPSGTPPDRSMHQLDKRFVPDVLPVLAGTTVHFPNDDVIAHNVFSLSRQHPFDLGLYPRGESRSVRFDEPGLIKIYCNIHSRMVASIVVLANPWFTVTTDDGSFELSAVPAGNATVRTWFPRTPRNSEQRVRVTDEGVYDINLRLVEDIHLEVREDSLTIQHKNKWGKEYPSRY